AVLRSAETAGATGIVLPRHRAAHITPAAAKAAAGAIEYLPIAAVAGIPAVIIQAERADVWTIGLDADGDGTIDELPRAYRPPARSCSCVARRVGGCRASRASVATSSPASRCTGTSRR